MSEAAPLLMRGEPGRAAVPAVETTLFRDEVLDQRQAQWLGTVLLAPRLSHRLFTLLALVAVAATIALLFFGEYARKARINGWLVPDLGLIQVFPPQSGLVTEVYAREGEEVQAGAPLLLLSTEVDSKVVGGTRKQIIRRLHERRTSLIAERERQKQLHQQQSEEGVARVAAITAERKQLQREIEAQRARAALGEKTAVQLRGLRAQQLVTEARLQSAEQDNLDQAVKLAATERALATLDQETLKLRGELRDLPLRHQTQLGEIERNMAALDQELAEAESRRQIQITRRNPAASAQSRPRRAVTRRRMCRCSASCRPARNCKRNCSGRADRSGLSGPGSASCCATRPFRTRNSAFTRAA